MTVYEALSLMIGFGTLIAMILIGVFTYLSSQKKKKPAIIRSTLFAKNIIKKNGHSIG